MVKDEWILAHRKHGGLRRLARSGRDVAVRVKVISSPRLSVSYQYNHQQCINDQVWLAELPSMPHTGVGCGSHAHGQPNWYERYLTELRSSAATLPSPFSISYLHHLPR